MTTALILIAWTALSVLLGIAIGRFIDAGKGPDGEE